MDIRSISNDDMLDILETEDKIADTVLEIVRDMDDNIVMSSIAGGFVNCIATRVNSMQEFADYRNFIIKVMDDVLLYVYKKKGESGNSKQTKQTKPTEDSSEP